MGRRKKGKTLTPLGARLRGVSPPAPRMVAGGRDTDALRYLALLADPCNASLVAPTYAGEGSGLFLRTKNMFSPGASAVDATIQFCPAFMTTNTAVQGGVSPILFASVNTTSTNPANIYGAAIAPTIFGSNNPAYTGIAGTARCLAACVKVHYTGSELNRAGLVFAGLQSTVVFQGAQTQTCPSAGAVGSCLPQIDRLGSRVHEYRWVPSFADEAFVSTFDDGSPLVNATPTIGNSLIVSLTGFPAGSVMFEVVSCWEYNVSMLQPAGIVSTASVPKSPSTLNDVLRTIGDIGAFALSAEGHQKVAGLIGNAARTVRDVAKVGAQFASVFL